MEHDIFTNQLLQTVCHIRFVNQEKIKSDAMPQLIVSRNASNYRVAPLSDTLTIGRDLDNDVVLESPQVSRHHAIIERKGTALYLTDCRSTNAIWVGKEKISSIRLENGMTFRIVDFLLTFIDEQQNSPVRVFAAKEENDRPGVEDVENKTIVFGLESFLPGEGEGGADLGKTLPIKQYTDLLTACRRLAEIDDEPELFSLLLGSAMELVTGKQGFIATRDKDGDLVYRATVNMDFEDKKTRIRDELISQTLATRATVLRNIPTNHCDLSNSENHESTILICCAPLFFEDHVEGCLYMESMDQELSVSEFSLLLELLLQYGSILFERLQYRVRVHLEREELKNRLAVSDETIIRSEAMLKLYEDIKTIAPINVPVLILGEAGSGKELVASALHSFSRRKGAYVALNCSAIPEGIFESELFGSVKGAFHNALDKAGKLETAHNGTLFLDEIGDMGLALQPKLLRFLEDREIVRLGDTKVKKLDVRVVAATNQDLDTMMREKKFREDFFQRLSCFVLKVPPLRERKEDIAPLIHYFLKRFAQEYNWTVPALTTPVLQNMVEYSWPGNVRELRNTVLRLSVQARGKKITSDDLARISETFGEEALQKVASFPSLEEMEKKYIRKALERAGWNISDAAKMVGIARSTFYQKMKKFKITTDEK